MILCIGHQSHTQEFHKYVPFYLFQNKNFKSHPFEPFYWPDWKKNPVMLPTSTSIDYRREILHHTMFQLSDSLREEKRSRKVEQSLTLHPLGSLCMQYMLRAVTVTPLNEAVSD